MLHLSIFVRGNQDEGTVYSAQRDHSDRLNGQLPNSSSEAPVNKVDRLYKVRENILKESHNGSDGDTVRDVEIMENINGQEAKDNGLENSALNGGNEISCSGDDEMDAGVWELPEAEDLEDDLHGSVAFNDDDDEECGDGTTWGKPSSLSWCGDEGSWSHRFKDEKQKAMEEVINGKFKAIVSHFLKTAGVVSLGKGGESWVDIVTSLSWEAASLLKPDAIDGKAMDLDGYVKVKCVAAGSRSER